MRVNVGEEALRADGDHLGHVGVVPLAEGVVQHVLQQFLVAWQNRVVVRVLVD